jgi:cation/acetate symporter
MPAALAATLIASMMTPAPGRTELELVRDLRMPGGETIYDREMRLLRLEQQRRA